MFLAEGVEMEREPEVLLLVLSSIQLLSIVLERESEFLRERNGLCFMSRDGVGVCLYIQREVHVRSL